MTRLHQRLQPKPDGESAVRHRTGVVNAVNPDGTVDLDLGGVVVPDVCTLAGSFVGVGAAVQTLAWAGDMLVIGGVGAAETIVYARAETVAAVAVAQSPATVVASAVLAVPTDWNTYDIEAFYQFDANDSSGGSTGVAVLIAAVTALDGTIFGQLLNQEMVNTDTLDVQHFAGATFIEGETTTGNRTVTLEVSRTAAFTVEARRRSLIAHAIRTS